MFGEFKLQPVWRDVDICVERKTSLYRLRQRKELLLEFVQTQRQADTDLDLITQAGKIAVSAVDEVLGGKILNFFSTAHDSHGQFAVRRLAI